MDQLQINKERQPKQDTYSIKMAVKKHELVHDDSYKLDIAELAQYVQVMNVQPTFLLPSSDLIKYCTDIVRCLSVSTVPQDVDTKQVLEKDLQAIEQFLQHVSSSLTRERRHEFVTAILNRFYAIISDPQAIASPATSIVLNVLGCNNSNAATATARWIINKAKEGSDIDTELRSSLDCLYRWLVQWNCTEYLADWIICFINTLEEEACINMLIDVSINNLEKLFDILFAPTSHRQAAAPVLIHVLACMRDLPAALDKIATKVRPALEWLAGDSGQWTRQLLQDLVDVIAAMVAKHKKSKTPSSSKASPSDKYADVVECLERHMASSGSSHLANRAWDYVSVENVCSNVVAEPYSHAGLRNLGNTCYMNSIMQALLLTRQFSRHAIMNMHSVPYWSKMSHLFTKMIHSMSSEIDPSEFFHLVKPPFFTRNNQHDSSEFLVYLLGLLQSFEQSTESPAFAERPVTNRILRAIQSSSGSESVELLAHDGSVSPRPSGSSCSSSGPSNHLKRPSSMQQNMLPIKKRALCGEWLHKKSFIYNMFGGVLVTRIKCRGCQNSSQRRDIFRDLQLAFPEKSEGNEHSVQSLLDFYCQVEMLTGSNRYDCKECGGLSNAERSVVIETPPKYLILVIKYFSFDPKLQIQTKLMQNVHHNRSILLPTIRYHEEKPSYELYAAVIHEGTTIDSGHYYTVGKHNDQWHIYNDDIVKLTTEEELNNLSKSRTPYMLFYRRYDIEETAAPSVNELPPELAESLMAHNKKLAEDEFRARHQ